jgi:ribosomal RNA-processing protein 12
LLSLLNCKL